MSTDNRRQAARVACDLPIRLVGEEIRLEARIVDLSRNGLRLCIAGTDLGVHRLSSLVQITRALQDVLGDTFDGELHHEMLGPLVRRTLAPTRIAKRDWENTDVEVGCAFDRPLTDDEAGMLGIPLPEVGTHRTPKELEGAGPRRRKPSDPPRPRINRGTGPAYVAWLYPAPGKAAMPLRTRTRSLSRGMAILEVEPGQHWEREGMAVSEAVMALDANYGTSVLIRIVKGDDDLYAGPAEVKEVDVVPGGVAIKLGLSFSRELRTEELGRLGLPTPA